MIYELSQAYPSKLMPLVIQSIDDQIFKLRYFMDCMGCDFCHDTCCSYGADIDLINVERILELENEIHRYGKIKKGYWFSTRKYEDHEFPGSFYTRTSTRGGACIFLNRHNRGCVLHSFCLDNHRDYHEIKPIVCSLFPVTFSNHRLVASSELVDESLICSKTGPSAYRGARNELIYYFGDGLVGELDLLEQKVNGVSL